MLTEAGRERFLEYIAVLESVVADAMAAQSPVVPLHECAGAIRRIPARNV